MGDWLHLLGNQVRSVTSTFDWNAPGLAFPAGRHRLAERYPNEYDLCLHVSIDDHWRLVDETWDDILDTENAVEPLDSVVHASPEERDRYASERRRDRSDEEKDVVACFAMQFNRWLDERR